ncbi:FRG domain-containing protein [Bacteroidia bacterium]|nr:FRG domain-containing protein [Bacteroidia bacterium]GHT46730.1 FRG domain-containing protein [Bacteroidia bacterium]
MNEICKIEDFYEILKTISENQDNVMYRGVCNSDFELIPSIGRFNTHKGQKFSLESEKLMLDIFKKYIYPYYPENIICNEMELLTIAQHHGLPTRLLDWTKNPLVAFFFAVEEHIDKFVNHSCIYIVHLPKAKLDSDINPFELTEVQKYIPKHWDKRIITQNGLFTIHNNPNEAWKPKGLEKILIKNDMVRKEIKKSLNRFGINYSTLFPDVDGIAKYVKYLRTNIY